KSLATLEALSRGTNPLANLATIRAIHKASTEAKNSLDRSQPALFVEARAEQKVDPRGDIRADGRTESRRLSARPLRSLAAGLEH
ncbi:hypothetical protein NL340_27610, partial [Klebsiella pneumoniae]|nr:hypothetical protein [Klebsiella pneumoniae]